jgi:protease-4
VVNSAVRRALRFIGIVAVGCGLAGCTNSSFLVTPVKSDMRLTELTVRSGSGWGAGKVAIIGLEGMLMNARSGGFLQQGENGLSLFAEELNHAATDPKVKAIVLRVNSPGGTVTTSDTMYQMVQRFKDQTHKPVVADFQEVAASGAYYVACAADKIVSHPTTVVGSIGVIFNTFDFEGTLGKIGARTESIKSGPLKDMGSMWKKLLPEERAVMQGMVDEYYARFINVVRTNRTKAATAGEEKFAEMTDGRVFSGQRAKELGLVDEVGLLDDAIKMAQEMANSPNAAVVMYKRPYGYRGSIYADTSTPEPRAANVTRLELPGVEGKPMMSGGFYYLWQP